MGWFWDKQPPSVRLCSCAHKHNRVLHQGGDEREGMKATLSYLADDKKNDNTHDARTALYVCTRANTHTHTPCKFVWKVTEVSHCHYTAHCCHFIVSHQLITQTKVCLHARTLHARTHTYTHTYTHTPFPYPADKSTKIISTYSGVTKPLVLQQNKLPF